MGRRTGRGSRPSRTGGRPGGECRAVPGAPRPGGTAGLWVYGPRAAGFGQVLRAAEILNFGKNPAFGSGGLWENLVHRMRGALAGSPP